MDLINVFNIIFPPNQLIILVNLFEQINLSICIIIIIFNLFKNLKLISIFYYF